MTSSTYLFTYLRDICIFSLGKCLFSSFAYFFKQSYFFNYSVLRVFIYYGFKSLIKYNSPILALILQLSFHFLNNTFEAQKIFNSDKAQFAYFGFVTCAFGIILKALSNLRLWGFTPVFSFKNFTAFVPTFGSLIHF